MGIYCSAMPTAVDIYNKATDGGLEELLRAGVDINTCNDEGSTALHFAAAYGNLAAAKLLVANKANVDLKNKVLLHALVLRQTALDYAEQCGNSEIAAFLRNQQRVPSAAEPAAEEAAALPEQVHLAIMAVPE